MRIRSRGRTDVGKKREQNEDSFLVADDLSLYVVADGMGGHAGGDIASKLAVETIERVIREARAGADNPFAVPAPLPESPLPDLLRDAVGAACAAIYRRANEDPELAGMGTTVSALLVHDRDVFIAHVGDSRVYLSRGRLIQQITEDHSLVNEQLKAGVITAEEARNSRFKNIITRSVGFEEDVLVDVMGLVAEPGDVFVLCSDGLANAVEDGEIGEMARRVAFAELPDRLVDHANARGGEDNITVVCVGFLP
jgi:protein phosphatase